MVGGERTFEGKFSSLSEPVSARANVRDADKQWNTAHILSASQRLQCSIKFITMPIN